MVKLTTRDRALALAVSIIETRAAEVEHGYVTWRERYPADTFGAATERSAYMECRLLARLVKERMSSAGRAALAEIDGQSREGEDGR